jgi:hypothetical protein
MKKIILTIFCLIAINSFQAYAVDYQFLEPSVTKVIPNNTFGFSTTDNPTNNADWEKTLIYLMYLSVFALISFQGGKIAFIFLSPDSSPEKRVEGKKMLRKVIIAIVFIVILWPLIYFLRPEMLAVNLNLDRIISPANNYGIINGNNTNTNSEDTSTTRSVTGDTTNRKTLQNVGISINKNDCSPSQWRETKPSCTSLEELPDETINMLVSLKDDCGGDSCAIQLTGGTEPGHKTHGKGLYPVDLHCQGGSSVGCNDSSTKLYQFITGKNPGIGYGGIGKSYCYKGKAFGPYKGFYFCNENIETTSSKAYHWHVFKQ